MTLLAGLSIYGLGSSPGIAQRGPAGEPPEIPELQVRPAPTLEPRLPEWRLPEEETLPERLREREALRPETLARRPAGPDDPAPPALVPPQRFAPEPETEAPAPLRIARLDPLDVSDELPFDAPVRRAAPAGAWTLAAGAGMGETTSDEGRAERPTPVAPDAPVLPPVAPDAPAHTPPPVAQDAPATTPDPARNPARPRAEDVLVAPQGSGPLGTLDDAPIGTNAKGVPVSLPKLAPANEPPSIVIDKQKPSLDTPAVLHVPVSDPAPDVAPDPLPNAPAPAAPTAPGIGSNTKPSLPLVAGGWTGRPAAPGHVQRAVVPEPGTLLLVAGGLLLLRRRRPER